MKDEEKAEEYASEKCKECYMCDYADYEHPEINPYKVCPYYTKRKEGYLEGLVEGRKESCEVCEKEGIKEYQKLFDKQKEIIEELKKENNSIKQILINLVTTFNNYECAGPEQEQENTWETLRDLMHEELLKIENGEIAK